MSEEIKDWQYWRDMCLTAEKERDALHQQLEKAAIAQAESLVVIQKQAHEIQVMAEALSKIRAGRYWVAYTPKEYSDIARAALAAHEGKGK